MKLLIVDDQMSVVDGLKRGVNWKACLLYTSIKLIDLLIAPLLGVL